jgi:hypothetical protein
MISRSCIPTLDLSALFLLTLTNSLCSSSWGNCWTESAPETAAAKRFEFLSSVRARVAAHACFARGDGGERKLYILRRLTKLQSMQPARVLILSGQFKGEEGICLGEDRNGRSAISPEGRDEILSLVRDEEFGLLIDLSADPIRN